MKSFKNHFFMLTIMALSIFNTNFIHTEGEFEQPDIQNQPSKSLLDRFKESEFNKRFSDKVNNFTRQSHDFFFKKYSKPEPTIPVEKPTNEDSSTVSFKTAEPVTTHAGDLPDEEFPTPPDNLTDWDLTTNEDHNLEKEALEAKNKRLDALEAQLPNITAAELKKITPEEIKKITPEEIQNLSIAINLLPDTIIPDLTSQQIQNMTIDQILAFDKDQITNFHIKNLTIQQIKKLVQFRSTGLLQNLTNAQLETLSAEQMEAFLEARPETFTPEQLEHLKNLLLLHGGSAIKIWLKDLSIKNFADIFKSDKTILKEYIQKAMQYADPKSKITDKVKQAVAKLSRTERMELFNDITHEELDANGRTTYNANNIFDRNKQLFSKIIPEHEMLVETISPNKLIVTRQFKLVNMRQVDPNLSLAENAEQIEKLQDLNYDLKDLEKNMRNYFLQKIDLNPFKETLNQINFKNVDINLLNPNFSNKHYGQKNIDATNDLKELINQIKESNSNVKMINDIELAKYLKSVARQ